MDSQKPHHPSQTARLDRRSASNPVLSECQTSATSAPELGHDDNSANRATMDSWLPPKSSASAWVSRMLPPKFPGAGGSWSAISPTGRRPLRLPDGHGGYVEIDPTVVHVEADGKKIPIPLPDPRRRWRQRAIFNLIAMLICLGILYVCFLLIMPNR